MNDPLTSVAHSGNSLNRTPPKRICCFDRLVGDILNTVYFGRFQAKIIFNVFYTFDLFAQMDYFYMTSSSNTPSSIFATMANSPMFQELSGSPYPLEPSDEGVVAHFLVIATITDPEPFFNGSCQPFHQNDGYLREIDGQWPPLSGSLKTCQHPSEAAGYGMCLPENYPYLPCLCGANNVWGHISLLAILASSQLCEFEGSPLRVFGLSFQPRPLVGDTSLYITGDPNMPFHLNQEGICLGPYQTHILGQFSLPSEATSQSRLGLEVYCDVENVLDRWVTVPTLSGRYLLALISALFLIGILK